MDYIDTSVLVAALTHEAATDRAQAWLGDAAAADLVISPWVVTEFSAAFVGEDANGGDHATAAR